MTEEIKELLRFLSRSDWYKEADQLEDYITNLQQENEKLKYNARGQVNDYFKDKYADEVLKNAKLKEENEFLKLNNPEQNIEHFRIVKENKRKIDSLRKENKKLKEELKNRPIVDFTFDVYKDLEELENYKSRFKKANEYMKDFIFEGLLVQEDRKLIMYNENLRKFENILNGSDENE